MVPDAQLLWQIYRDKVDRARKMPGETKALEALQLFEQSCRMMADGVRFQHPQASEEEVNRIVRERMALARRLDRKL